MEHPPADPAKLLDAWMEWERGETPPGRVMSTLKTGGLRQLLEGLTAGPNTAAGPTTAAGTDSVEGPGSELPGDLGASSGVAAQVETDSWTPVV